MLKEKLITSESYSELEKYYKYVYKCKCGRYYGSDEEEKGNPICPICEEKLKSKSK